MKKLRYLLWALLSVLLCCKKPYEPQVAAAPASYLVVEGVINSGSDSTIIKLSKTVNVSSKTTANPVLGATVVVESDNGIIYHLIDFNGNGNYSAVSLNLPAAPKYRLHIKTSAGSEYVSDYMAIKPTPPIDSIGFTPNGSNARLYVDTHDATNSTRYYRWEYQETWQFHSKYYSTFVLDNNTNTIVARTPTQQVYYCFGSDASTGILLNSTTDLAQDVVSHSPLVIFPFTSEKFEIKYSILVRQYALTQEAYKFYSDLKKNTELTGSIFDSQPSQLNTNLHCLNNPAELVIGYVTATNIQSKRVFITPDRFPTDYTTVYPYDCEEPQAFYNDMHGNDVQTILINPPLTDIPTTPIYDKTGKIIGFNYSTPLCVDCTLRGTKATPSFWR